MTGKLRTEFTSPLTKSTSSGYETLLSLPIWPRLCFLVQCRREPVGDPVQINRTQILIAWEQALWGTLVVGWEKERELATTSLEKKSMRNADWRR